VIPDRCREAEEPLEFKHLARPVDSTPMRGSKLSILLGTALLLGALPALSDQADGRYDLPDHTLAAGDPIGTRLFDRDKHVVLRPRHEKRLRPDLERAPGELPPWPANWASQPEEDE
jgi:hypothetical protein